MDGYGSSCAARIPSRTSHYSSHRGYSESGTSMAPFSSLNRALSIRSNKGSSHGASSTGTSSKRGFSFMSLRGSIHPEISRRLYRLVKSQTNLVGAHDTASKERNAIAQQLSEWGEQTHDDAISDVSDKIGVVVAELGELDDMYAHALDDAKAHLKAIRNTERSVQPSRDGKGKIADEIQKIKIKEPQSTKLVVLEQELVRAEAENLVAEAQLANISRQKLKEAYATEFAATIERAEKQIILAKHGRRLLALLDDQPVVPGDVRPAYRHAHQARQILNDAEDDLRDWQPDNTDQFLTPTTGQSPTSAPEAPMLGSPNTTRDDKGKQVLRDESDVEGSGVASDARADAQHDRSF